MQNRHKVRKRRHAAPIGGAFILLALIGVVALVVFSINLTSRVLDNSSEKERLEQVVRPVLMFDPAPFEKATDIAPTQMLEFCMWANLSSERRDTYAYADGAEIIIPASDLDVVATRLFGSDVVLEHQSFGSLDTIRYNYDKESNCYYVPLSAQLFVYSPQVEKIERDGDLYNVYVNYIPPVDAWTADFSGNRGQPSPDKQMVYVVKKQGDNYQIVALRDPPSVQAAQTHIIPNQSQQG